MSSPSQPVRSWRREEHPLWALAQVLAVGLLMAAGVFLWVRHAQARSATATRLVEAQTLQLAGNPEDLREARQILEALREASPGDDALRLTLAELDTELWLTHGIAEAQASSEALVARGTSDPSERQLALQLRHALGHGDPTAARTLLEAHDGPIRHPELALAEAQLLWMEGSLEAAAERLEKLVHRRLQAPRALLIAAELAQDALDPGLARQHLERGRRVVPKHRGLALAAALLEVRSGRDAPDAKGLVEAVLDGPPTAASPRHMAQAHALRAAVAQAAGDPRTAVAEAEAGLRANPRDPDAAEARARALLALGSDDADRAFLEALSRRPTNRRMAFDATELLLGAQRLAGANALLEAYAKTFSGVRATGPEGTTPLLDRDGRYWLAHGRLKAAQGQPDAALADLDRAIAIPSVFQAPALWEKGRVLLTRGDLTGAREVLSRITPEDGSGPLPEAYRSMGALLFSTRDFQRGALHYGFALSGLLLRGGSLQDAAALREEVAQALRGARQAKLASAWLEETLPLLRPPTGT